MHKVKLLSFILYFILQQKYTECSLSNDKVIVNMNKSTY